MDKRYGPRLDINQFVLTLDSVELNNPLIVDGLYYSNGANQCYKNDIEYVIKRIREQYGQDYPRNIAEYKSLISWLHTDFFKNMIAEDEVDNMVSEIIFGDDWRDNMSNDFAKESICIAIKRIRELYGQDYPRNIAEHKSLVSWLHTDVCKGMLYEDEIEKIVSEITGE